MKRPHAELIKAWADGAEIEYLDDVGMWDLIEKPSWIPRTSYRIKQVPRFRVLYQDLNSPLPLVSSSYFESLEAFSAKHSPNLFKPLQLLESQREVL